MFWKLEQKVTKYLGFFCKKNSGEKTFKNHPIWLDIDLARYEVTNYLEPNLLAEGKLFYT